MAKVLTTIFLCLVIVGSAFGQSSSQWGSLPEITISKKISPSGGLALQLESMIQSGLQTPNESLKFENRHIRTDLALFYSHTLSPNWKLAGAFLYRLRTGSNAYRTTQQVSYSKRSSSIRFAHRIRTDQTYRPELNTIWRFRYRYSIELPLQGADLNDNEFYLISSAEILFITSKGQSTFQQRLSSSIGYFINNRNKFEIGIDYRATDVFDVLDLHQSWLSLNYFLNLK